MRAIDPSMTFKSFVVGAENRLAWDAARKAAERPGTAYNPLFIYSATGLGKTHLLVAIANRIKELQPETRVLYMPLEPLLRRLASDSKAKSGVDKSEILLIDDLQFLEHDPNGHRLLFHLLDSMLMSGRQVALACDRPPIELGELDDRLLSRFSGGLIVDIGRPVLETRRAILDLRLGALGQSLEPGVIDAIARLAIENVRQLQGALNRVLAAEEAEGRSIQPDEVDRLLADVVSGSETPWLSEVKDRSREEFSDFLTDVSTAVEEALGTPRWRETLARGILKWESEGYVTKRLEDLLDQDKPVNADEVTARYERREDGGIRVLNRGYKAAKDSWKEAEGKAYFTGETDTGHLKVSFFGPFYASYVVFDLDPDYQWAYVAGYSKDYLWLLARSPVLSAEQKQHFVDSARALDFPVDELIWVEQPGPR